MTGSLGRSNRALVLLVVLVLSSIVVGISVRIPNGGVLPEAFAHLGGDECTLLGGTVVVGPPSECQISSFVAKTSTAHGGSFDISDTLRINGTGRIDASGGGITINISGGLILESPTVANGGQIEANDPSSPTGNSASPITLNVSGNVEMQAGSVIEARNTVGAGNGANIAITVTGNLLMALGARVDSSASGASQNTAGNLAFTVGGNMEMSSGTVIKAESAKNGNGGSITIPVTGNLTLRGEITGPPLVAGAIISSSVVGGTGGDAGSITVNVGNCAATPPTGDLVVEPGAKVKANSAKGAGGAIVMNSCRHITMDGLVESASGRSGTGAKQGPGGGTITLDAGCDLTISNDGKVSSRGQDPGADLVHVEGGCSVLIFGIVESTGKGHAVPNSPKNHCDSNNRPDKSPSSTTCVEVWAGDKLTIDSDTGEGHNGEVSADGGPGGRGWIDLFARGDITIDGDTTGSFAVHANRAGGTDQVGGNVTVKSTEGKVTASGLAISADGYVAGGTGGWIIIEAKLDVNLDTASLFARGYVRGGRIGTLGGDGVGGANDIAGIRSYTGMVSWKNGVGDVQPTGTAIGAANRGEVIFQNCTGGDTTGTSFPYSGLAATTPTALGQACDGAPTLPDYVTLPDCLCRELVHPCKWCTKGAVLSQVTQNLGHCCAVPDILVDLRLPKDDPIEQDELGSNIPATGSLQAAIDYVTAPGWPSLDPTPGDGEIFIGVTAKDCGTGIAGSPPDCAGLSGRGPYGDGTENVVITNPWEDVRLNVFGCSVDLYAADPAKPVVTIVGSTGKVTVLDIHVRGGSEGYHIENNADLVVVKNGRAIGNTNYGYYILDNKVEITGSPEISGNGVGVKIVGNNVILRTNKVLSNTGVGIDVQGDDNVVRGGLVQENGGHGIAVHSDRNEIKDLDVYLNVGDGINIAGNENLITSNDVGEKGKGNVGDGIHVVGNGNTFDGNSVFGNHGDGIEVVGSNNLIKRNDIGEKDKGNGGDGLRVDGAGNTLQENDAFANGGDGIHVSGGISTNPNVLKKNRAGDRGKGNGGNGIWVEGVGDGKNGKVEIEENTAKSNGLDGFKVTGTGHQLKKNVSGGSSSADKNGLCAFEVVAGNFNATGNKRNNVTISGSNGSAFPTGCIGPP